MRIKRSTRGRQGFAGERPNQSSMRQRQQLRTGRLSENAQRRENNVQTGAQLHQQLGQHYLRNTQYHYYGNNDASDAMNYYYSNFNPYPAVSGHYPVHPPNQIGVAPSNADFLNNSLGRLQISGGPQPRASGHHNGQPASSRTPPAGRQFARNEERRQSSRVGRHQSATRAESQQRRNNAQHSSDAQQRSTLVTLFT